MNEEGAMEVKIDSNDHEYLEVDIGYGHAMRLTFLPNLWGKEDSPPGLRFQLRDSEGKVRPGPEVPMSAVGDLSKAMIMLLTRALLYWPK